MYQVLENTLEKNPENFDFGGWEYNIDIDIESLRKMSLKTFIECRIEELLIHTK